MMGFVFVSPWECIRLLVLVLTGLVINPDRPDIPVSINEGFWIGVDKVWNKYQHPTSTTTQGIVTHQRSYWGNRIADS